MSLWVITTMQSHYFVTLLSNLVCVCLSLTPLGCWKLMTQMSLKVRWTCYLHCTQILYCSTCCFLIQLLPISQSESSTELTADVSSTYWCWHFNNPPVSRGVASYYPWWWAYFAIRNKRVMFDIDFLTFCPNFACLFEYILMLFCSSVDSNTVMWYTCLVPHSLHSNFWTYSCVEMIYLDHGQLSLLISIVWDHSFELL